MLLKQRELAKEELPIERINLILLQEDFRGRAVSDKFEKKAAPDELNKLSDWAKKELTLEEIKSTLLFQSDLDVDINFWHIAVKYCGLESLLEIWVGLKGD